MVPGDRHTTVYCWLQASTVALHRRAVLTDPDLLLLANAVSAARAQVRPGLVGISGYSRRRDSKPREQLSSRDASVFHASRLRALTTACSMPLERMFCTHRPTT